MVANTHWGSFFSSLAVPSVLAALLFVYATSILPTRCQTIGNVANNNQQLQQQQQPQSSEVVTRQCIDQAHFRDCAVFTHCCTRLCPQGQGHRCMALLGMIQLGQTGCDCPTASSAFAPPASQSAANQWPPAPFSQPQPQQQSQTASQWPSPSSWPSAAGSAVSASIQPTAQFLSNLTSTISRQFQRPPPTDPSALRHLFQSAVGGGNTAPPPAARSSALSSIQRMSRFGSSSRWNARWWHEFDKKVDFVGGILFLFVVDLLLLTLAM